MSELRECRVKQRFAELRHDALLPSVYSEKFPPKIFALDMSRSASSHENLNIFTVIKEESDLVSDVQS